MPPRGVFILLCNVVRRVGTSMHTLEPAGKKFLSLDARICLALFLTALVYGLSAKWLQVHCFRLQDFDTGIYSNLAWNIASGKGFWSDVLNKNHLGDHFSPVTAIVAPLYWLQATPFNLFIPLSLAYAASFVVVWLLLRDILGENRGKGFWCVWLLLLMYFFCKPLNSGFYYQFKPTTLTLPFVGLALLSLRRKHYVLLSVSVAMLFFIRENSALAVIGISLYALLVLKDKKAACWLFIAALVYAAFVFKLFMPYFQTAKWGHYSRLGLLYDWPGKLSYLRYLLASFAFLPLFAPRALAAALPLTALNLSVSVKRQYSLTGQYDDLAIVLFIAASAHGLLALKNSRLAKRPLGMAAFAVFLGAMFAGVNKDDLRFKRFRALTALLGNTSVPVLREELKPYMDDKSIPIAASRAVGPYVGMRGFYRPLYTADLNALPRDALLLVSPLAETINRNDLAQLDELKADGRLRIRHESPVLVVFEFREKF